MRKTNSGELTPNPSLCKRGAFGIVINIPLLLLREGARG
jgi:hypothetical protein